MATSYTRRINLYINGKQVSADIVSIRKEMSKLVNEQARMTLGSKEYVKHTAKIKSLKTIIDQHNKDISTTIKQESGFSKLADAANKYFAVIAAGGAAVAGAVTIVKQTVEAFAEYDDKLVDVMKTTDLSKQETKALNEEIRKIDTRTAQLELLELARVAGKLGIRGKQDVLGFVNATDKIKVALAEDLGGDTEEAVRQLGKLVDIFKLTNDFTMEESLIKIGSAMNALGASGTANEGYMLEFTKRIAGVAPTAGITIDKILGIATTLDELGQTSEVSGTAFNQVISNMFKKTADYAKVAGMELQDFTDLMNTDANEAFIQLLIGAKGSSDGFGELANSLSSLGMDGVRATAVLGVLASNIDKLRENQKFSNEEFVKGNSLLIEFNKKNNSAQAQLEKAGKIFKQVQVDLGEKLSPIYASTIHKASTLLKVFGATVEFLFKYGKTIVFATGYLITYTIAVKALALWEARKNAQVGIGLVLAKLNTAAYAAQFAAIALYNAAVAFLTGNLALATTSLRAFSVALNATPIGWIFTAIGALILAIRSYDKYMGGATVRAEQQAKALKDLNIMTDAYTGHLEKLNDTIKDSNTLTLEQKKLMAEQSAEMIAAIENTIRLQKLEQDTLIETNTRATLWQKTVNIFKSGGNPYLAAAYNMQDAVENAWEAGETMKTGIEQLEGTKTGLLGAAKQINEIVNAESLGDKIGVQSLVMMNEKLSKYKIALDNAIFGGEDYLRIQKKIAEVESRMGETKVQSIDKAKKTAFDSNESKNTKAQNEIKKQLLAKAITEEQANEAILSAEIEFLEKKKAIQIKFGDDYLDTESAIIDKKLQVAKEADKKSEDERKKANTKTLKDLDNKEAEELNIIKKQLSEKTITEEQAQQDILEKEIEFLNQKIALKKQWGEDTAELEGKVLDKTNEIAENALKNDEARAKQLYDLRKDYEDEEVAKAQEKAAALAELDSLYKAGMLNSEEEYQRLKTKIVEKYEGTRYEKTKAYLGAVNDILGGASQFFSDLKESELAEAGDNTKKREQIEKEYAQKQKTIAIGQAIIAGAMAVMELWATKSVIPSPANEIYKGVMTGVIAGTTIAQIAKIKSAKFSDGGPTGPGGKHEPAGIVHKGEYILSQDMLADPNVRYLTKIFEKMRTRKVSLSQAAMPLLSSGGFSSTNKSSGPMILPDYPDNSKTMNHLIQTNLQLEKAINVFMEYRPIVAVETIEREREKYLRIKQTSGL